MKRRTSGTVVSTVLGVLFTGGVLGMAVGGMGAGIRACMAIAEMKPHPILLTCGAGAPVRAEVPRATPRVEPTPFELPLADLLATTEPQTHDPGVLAVRALAMKSAGIPVDVVVVGIPHEVMAKRLGFNVGTTPVARASRYHADGVELSTIPKGSILERAGLRQGDVVLSVNGYPAADPTWFEHVNTDPGTSTVAELVRDKKRVVLVVEWLP